MNRINKIITTECMIIQHAKETIYRIPIQHCLPLASHWKVIEKNGYLIVGGLIHPKITDAELECLALLHPVRHPQSKSDTSCLNYSAASKK